MPCMVVSAVCCSVSLPNRMKPKPLLVPVSSKTTEKFSELISRLYSQQYYNTHLTSFTDMICFTVHRDKYVYNKIYVDKFF